MSLRSRLSDPAARPRLWRQTVLIIAALLVVFIGYRILLPPAVPVLSVHRGPLVQTVVATGRVRADTRTRLGASITGTVTRVLVREGDTVRAGQLLAELDSRELAAAVAQARASLQQQKEVRRPVTAASLRQAEAAYQKAEADFRRAETLLKGGATSEDQYEQSRQLLETARSQRDIARAQASATETTGADVMAAEATLASAEARLAYTRITAPADGIVLTRNLEPGDAVQPGRTLLELALRARTMLSVVPDEKNLARLAVGQPAQASADAFPELRFRARVAYVSPVVDPAQGTVEVRLAVDSVPAYLRPDMTVSVDIEVARLDSAVVIPLEAVREPLSPRPWTLVVRDRHIVRQPLTLGIRGEELAQVLDGVKAGELVVPLSARGVAVGERVRARRE